MSFILLCSRLWQDEKSIHTLAILYTSRDQAELIFSLGDRVLLCRWSWSWTFIFMPWSSKSWNHSYISQCLIAISARMLIGLILYRFCAGNLSCYKFRSVDRASLSSPGWPRTYHVDQHDLKCVVVLWQVPRLQVYIITPRPFSSSWICWRRKLFIYLLIGFSRVFSV